MSVIDYDAALDEGAWSIEGAVCYQCRETCLGTGILLHEKGNTRDLSYRRLGYWRFWTHANHPECVVEVLFAAGEEAEARQILEQKLTVLLNEAQA